MKPAVFTSRAEQLLLMLESKTKDTASETLIFQRANGKPLILETANKHFKASCVRAGVEPLGRTQYCLRHSFNTHLIGRENDPQYVFGADDVAAPEIYERKTARRFSYPTDQSSSGQSFSK